MEEGICGLAVATKRGCGSLVDWLVKADINDKWWDLGV